MTNSNSIHLEGASCPVPNKHEDQIILGHGSGGKLTQDLIKRSFLPSFNNQILAEFNDSGVFDLNHLNDKNRNDDNK